MSQASLFGDEEPSPFDWFGPLAEIIDLKPEPDWQSHFGRKLLGASSAPSQIRTLSLFSGGGGLDIAFHDLGFEIGEMVEIEKDFAKTLEFHSQPGRRFAGARVNAIDVRDFTVDADAEYDFIIGGPPCQTFSAAGRRASGVLGTSDARGTLFAEYVRLLQSVRPKGFLFENVYAILGARGGKDWVEIVEAFRNVGYVLSWRILDAADFGVPQHRERLFIIGIREDIADATGPFKFPRPTHGPDSYSSRPAISAGEALQDVPGVSENTVVGGRYAHLLPEIPPGLNYSYFTEELGYPSPIFAWRSKFSDFLYKADPASPVRTIKAQGGAFTGPLSWANRHFTSAEMKRLQTFPDDYFIEGSRLRIVHQIGNSVPPQMGRILALAVLDQLFGFALPSPISYLDESEVLGFRNRKRLLTVHYKRKAAEARASNAQVTSRKLTKGDVTSGRYFLSEDFYLAREALDVGSSFDIAVKHSATNLRVDVRQDMPEEKSDFSLTMRPSEAGWTIPLESIEVVANECDIRGFTASFRLVEAWIRAKYGVDDLVQLSGYYQYSPRVLVELTVRNAPRVTRGFWSALPAVTGGTLVGRNLREFELSKALGLDVEVVPMFMAWLKRMGYEIRSQGTNSQISDGHFLLPYAFPTLTPRSVQLRKAL